MIKNKILDSLQSSVKQERKSLESKKNNSTIDRFAAADSLFEENPTQKVQSPSIKKDVIIRDTFTLPEKEYCLIDKCKNRLLENKLSATKSEVLRTALVILDSCTNEQLVSYYKLLKKVRVGRPKRKDKN